jgi:benzoyl-CoA 2,3-dioxygenase component B
MFTYFTDRDGKYQLLALSESGFDPLARSCKFMLTEEAHHMFVGETGVLRVVQRTCELMKQNKNEDARAEGGIDLHLIQRYLNFWFSVSLDLFGGEISSNAASFFAGSLKGRAKEESYEDHKVIDGVYDMQVPVAGELGAFKSEAVPLRTAMNEVLRDEYIEDAQRGVDKWNRAIEEAGYSFRLTLPSRRFHRAVGIYGGLAFDPAGNAITKEEWERKKDEWIPSAADEKYVQSLMKTPVYEAGKMAHWIAPPARGIKGKPVEFEYVRHDAH